MSGEARNFKKKKSENAFLSWVYQETVLVTKDAECYSVFPTDTSALKSAHWGVKRGDSTHCSFLANFTKVASDCHCYKIPSVWGFNDFSLSSIQLNVVLWYLEITMCMATLLPSKCSNRVLLIQITPAHPEGSLASFLKVQALLCTSEQCRTLTS